MANEVNNQTEETATPDNSGTEQATNSAATAAENNTDNMAADTFSADEPESATDIDFGSILEQFEQEQTVFHTGELVTGTVVGISDRGVLVDFGYKSEGIVPIEDFTSPSGEVTVNRGDQIEVVIRTIHSGDAPPMLSRGDAISRKSWGEIEAAYNAGSPIRGYVIDKTKGGLRVDIHGVEAFLPGSQVDSRPIRNLDSFVGKEIEAKIIKFSRRRNNIVLSRKALTDESVNQQKAETLNQIEIGYVVEGTIKNLTEYGAFVDIGGIDGLLHVREMAWGRVEHPSQVVKKGQKLQVLILELDEERKRVALGLKQLLPDPWKKAAKSFSVGQTIKGKVVRLAPTCAFVELEPGVEAIVPISEISEERIKTVEEALEVGQEVEGRIKSIQSNVRRITMSLRAAVVEKERQETRSAVREVNTRATDDGPLRLGDLFGNELRAARDRGKERVKTREQVRAQQAEEADVDDDDFVEDDIADDADDIDVDVSAYSSSALADEPISLGDTAAATENESVE